MMYVILLTINEPDFMKKNHEKRIQMNEGDVVGFHMISYENCQKRQP